MAPLNSSAQQSGKVWRVGSLSARARPGSLESDALSGAFLRGLRELGYAEGKNLAIEWRFAEGSAERLQGYADELARLKMDVIVTENTTATHAAKKATATIPIVMASSSDPVHAGFVKSLARPEGSITGLSSLSSNTVAKHLQMLLGIAPGVSRVALLMNPANSGNFLILKSLQTAAGGTKAKILPVEARTAPEIEKAFAAMIREKAGALIVAPDSLINQQAGQIAERAVKHRLASIGWPMYAEAGGLMGYGPSVTDMHQRAAYFVDKIFKGAKPADLPVEQTAKFESIINRKTAKALGLTIPPSLLVSADRVID